MEFFSLFGYASILLVGGATLFAIQGKEAQFSRLDFLGLSFFLGSVIIPIFFLIVGFFGIPWTSGVIFGGSFILFSLVMIWGFLQQKKLSFTPIRWNSTEFHGWKLGISIFLSILIGMKLFFGFSTILFAPTYVDDALANWNLRGKIWYEHESIILDKKDPQFLGSGYIQYPITVSFLKTYLSHFAGKWSEPVVNSITFVFTLFGLMLLWSFINRVSGSAFLGLIACQFLLSLPLFLIHSIYPYADSILGWYAMIAGYLGWQALRNEISFTLFLLFSLLLAYIKTEGLLIFFLGIALAYFLATVPKIRKSPSVVSKFFWPIILGCGVLLPLLGFKWYFGLGFGNGNESVSQAAEGFTPHWEVFGNLWIAWFQEGNFLLFLPILFATLFVHLFQWKKQSIEMHFLFFAISSILAAFFLVYFGTFAYQYTVDQTGSNRSIVQLAPLALLYVFLFWIKKQEMESHPENTYCFENLVLLKQLLGIFKHESFGSKCYLCLRMAIFPSTYLKILPTLVQKNDRILDIGCGYGILSFFLAQKFPEQTILGVDIDENRIQQSQKAAHMAHIEHLNFITRNLITEGFSGLEGYRTALLTDVLHHLDECTQLQLLQFLSKHSQTIIIKCIDIQPKYKYAWNYFHDRYLMGNTLLCFLGSKRIRAELENLGYTVEAQEIQSMFPYPHYLLIGRR